MKLNISITIMFVLLFNSRCWDGDFSTSANSQSNNVEPFKDYYERFISDFNEKNISELNKCIYSEIGFFVLDNPGAFSIAKHFNLFNEIMEIEGQSDIGYLKVVKVKCNLQEGSAPVYDCDQDKWNKEGCFLDKYSKLSISEYYKNMLNYNLEDINKIKIELAIADKSDIYISHLVYSTKDDIGFYFGIIDNNWYLICIDKITPCSA